jgi:hypothetical protein
MRGNVFCRKSLTTPGLSLLSCCDQLFPVEVIKMSLTPQICGYHQEMPDKGAIRDLRR